MNRRVYVTLWYGLGAAGVALAAAVAAAPGRVDEQVLRSAEGYTRERDPDTLRDMLTLEESRTAPDRLITQPKSGAYVESTSVLYGDHWIYEARTEIFLDADHDGYYRYLRVRFDVDSYFDPAWVYAKLYLSADGELWELYFETEDFLVHGAAPGDEYEVETELVASYPTGLYDVLIEVYDADTGVFVDEFGPAESSAFALLPLEDTGYDVPPVAVSHGHGGGGAASWAMLLLLGGAVLSILHRAVLGEKFAQRAKFLTPRAASPPNEADVAVVVVAERVRLYLGVLQ